MLFKKKKKQKDFTIESKTGKTIPMGVIRRMCYRLAALSIILPLIYVMINQNVDFTGTSATMVINVAAVFVALGKFITIQQKKGEGKSFASEIGVLIGLAVVILSGLL